MKKKAIISLVLIAMLAFGIGAGSFAWFTSQATSTDNVFTAGTLTIDSPGTIATSDLGVSNIYPSWNESKTVTVHNNGSLDFKYRMSVQALTENILYDGTTPLQVKVNGGDWENINALGVDGYIELGTIAAGGDDTFTIAFRLPEAANDTYQAASGTFSFVFDATQTTNPGWAQ